MPSVEFDIDAAVFSVITAPPVEEGCVKGGNGKAVFVSELEGAMILRKYEEVVEDCVEKVPADEKETVTADAVVIEELEEVN